MVRKEEKKNQRERKSEVGFQVLLWIAKNCNEWRKRTRTRETLNAMK